MKTFDWLIPDVASWTSFDYGSVEAETIEEATEIAKANLTKDLVKVNEILKPHNFSINIAMGNISIEERPTRK